MSNHTSFDDSGLPAVDEPGRSMRRELDANAISWFLRYLKQEAEAAGMPRTAKRISLAVQAAVDEQSAGETGLPH